ncbi:hypothetical protein B7P43_G12710 [Cryptotermes secundus]|uniref:RAE1/2 domain-containing protein n=1 Tax=Cryptotermes secundus TaxID=105785 RepID=A0A2J7PZ29_9NEOP|nr:hypothetical protein B7P43_G12710 [Cryptotermes secundus]
MTILPQKNKPFIDFCFCLRSILLADKESLTLLQFPPVDGSSEPVTVIEVGPSTNACPPGMYVVHMTCKQQTTAREDLKTVVAKLLHTDSITNSADSSAQSPNKKQSEDGEGEEVGDTAKCEPVKPQVLWSLYFNCPETSKCDFTANIPAKVYLCSGPDLDLDFEYAVTEAKAIFSKMYPDSEFLPRAPDPEEILLEGEESAPGPIFEGDCAKAENDGHKTEDGDSDQTKGEEAE